jgi:hypothetical protein
MNSKQGLLITIVGMGLLMNSGCAAVLVGGAAAGAAGTVLYVKGELHSTEGVSLDRAWNATQAAIGDMGFTVTAKDKDAVSAELNAITADGKRIKIVLNREADNVTEISIRVGTFGDESMSRLILERIRKRF